MRRPTTSRGYGVLYVSAPLRSLPVSRLWIVLLPMLCLLPLRAYSQPTVYWTQQFGNAIRAADLIVPEELVSGLASPRGLALDGEAGRMYWINEDKIQRATLDGTEVEDLVTGLAAPGALALDTDGQWLYWSDGEAIRRATLDGTNVQDLIADHATDLALDVAGGKVYWIGFNAIRRANLDGSAIEDLVTGYVDLEGQILDYPVEFALDATHGKLYWTTTFFSGGAAIYYDQKPIKRADLDGSNVETIYTQIGIITGLAVDPAAGNLYWADQQLSERNDIAPVIQRAEIDGTQVENLLAGLSLDDLAYPFLHPGSYPTRPRGGTTLALDTNSGMLYWITDGKIKRVPRDGTRLRDIVTGLGRPQGLVLDRAAEKLYWADAGAGKIQRANRDGTAIEDLVTDLESPRSIVLDIADGKLYWTDAGAGKIQRANLDGSEVEDLITGLDAPIGLAYDAGEGHLYWTEGDESTRSTRIRRANLNGSGMEVPFTTEWGFDGRARDLALDLAAGKMYFSFIETVDRANLDGSGHETDLATRGCFMPYPGGMALDETQGRLYFGYIDPLTIDANDSPPAGVGFINLNGSGCERIFETLDMSDKPRSIALELDEPVPSSTASPLPAPDAYPLNLSAAYPNPFRSETRFTLMLNQAQSVRLDVFDLLGRRVALLHNGMLGGARQHVFTLEAGSLPSGVYLIRAQGEQFTSIQKVIVSK